MKKMFQGVNLCITLRVLVVLIAGISQATGAQVAFHSVLPSSSPTTDKTKAEQQPGSDPTNIQHCEAAAKEAAQLPGHGSHTVTLSWQASIPAKDDSIRCYVVYRDVNSFDEKVAVPIGVTYAPATTLVDLRVEPGNYFYAVKAVSQHEQESRFSQVLPVQVH